MRRLLTIGFLCLSVSCGFLQSPVRREVDRFLTLLRQGKYSATINELPASQKRSMEVRFGSIQESNYPVEYQAKNMVSYEILGIEASSDSAVAHIKITTKDGLFHVRDLDLVKEGEQWKVRF